MTNLTVKAKAAKPTSTIMLVSIDCKLLDSAAGGVWLFDSTVLFIAARLLSSACENTVDSGTNNLIHGKETNLDISNIFRKKLAELLIV